MNVVLHIKQIEPFLQEETKDTKRTRKRNPRYADPGPESVHHSLPENNRKSLKTAKERMELIGKTLIEIGEVGMFRMVDVEGDGNCFFNALCVCPEIRMEDPSELRQTLVEFLMNNGEAASVYTNVLKQIVPYETFIRKLRRRGTWAGTSAAVFICMMFNVNIVIVSNAVNGLICNNIREWENIDFIDESSSSIYLYHHLYKKPFTKSRVCNHFAYLYQYEESNPGTKFEVYKNSFEKSTGSVEAALSSDEDINTIDLPQTKRQKNEDCIDTRKDHEGRAKENKVAKVSITTSPPKNLNVVKRQKSNGVALGCNKNFKTTKQSVLMEYLVKMKVDKEEVQTLIAKHRSNEDFQEFEIQREVQIILLNLVGCIDKESGNIDTSRYIRPRSTNVHATWEFRALVIAFWVHPYLGCKNYELSSRIFSVNENTLRTWVTQQQFLHKWLPIAKTLTFDDVLCSVPAPYNLAYATVSVEDKGYASLYRPYCNKASQTYLVLCNNPRDVATTHQKKLALAKKNPNTVYVSSKTKHIHHGTKKGPRNKYENVRTYISDVVSHRWTCGNPISKAQLKDMISLHFAVDPDFREKVLNSSNYFNKWVSRVLNDLNFADRKSSIAQKIPDDWRCVALNGAERIRKLFKSHGIMRIFAADETNIKFHEVSDSVLAPQGVKRVGTACKISSNDGCTLMVTMDMTTSQLAPPLIIYKGTFGGTLMKKWQNFSKAVVVFTEKHWMTQQVFILYLQHLRLICPGHEKIGIIIDKASMHTSNDVRDWIEETNQTEKPMIVYDFIEAGMTSIYQPPDVVINKPLKDKMKKMYGKYRNEIASNFVPGEMIQISREKLTDLILEAYTQINEENMGNMYIRRAFDLCGLNPYADEKCINRSFVAHLDSLSSTTAYQALIDHNTALELN